MTLEQAIEVLIDRYNSSVIRSRTNDDEWRLATDTAIAALRLLGWVRTADRLPEGDEHDGILGLYNGPGYLLYDSVRIGWLRSHPEMYVYWTHLPKKPEVEG